MATVIEDERLPGAGHTVLAVMPHADDAALFCGGTLRRMAERGARVVLLRVTDDRFDSVGHSIADTVARNTRELHVAAQHLGIAEVHELGWKTDHLGDARETVLRERFIWYVRKFKPYAVISFDPYGAYHEDNLDHVRIAQAVDETYWTAQFDKHHPEHLAAGLEPHGVYERWYFARRLTEVTTVVDISSTIEHKVNAALAHDTMLRNYVHQLRLQARTGGHTIERLEAAQNGELRALMEPMIRGGAVACGRRHGVPMAEEFRVVRFGGLERYLGIGSDG